MSNTVISVENLSKTYRLGQIGTGSLSYDLKVWWAKMRGMPNPLLKIDDADHGNREGEEILALQDVSFNVEQGEVLGIIGRNGAGKSTLLKILSRVTAPTSGHARVKGRIASLLEVGTGFHQDLTGRENIYLNGAILGMNKREIHHKFDEIVNFAEVEQFIDTPVKRYSSGMYVRLAFAVAAHLEPEILLIDEVLAVGDAQFQKKCLGKLGDVAQDGRTVLFISHNMAAIENLCCRGIVLNGGKVICDDSQSEAIAEYFKLFREQKQSLRDRERTGSGLVRVVKVEFQDTTGKPLDVLQSGQDVDICLFYETDPRYAGERTHVGFTISTHLGVKVFNQNTRINNIEFDNLPPSGVFVCRIPELPLSSSSYLFNFVVKVNEMYSEGGDNQIEFTVVDGDFFGTGRIQPSVLGASLVKGEWHLSKAIV